MHAARRHGAARAFKLVGTPVARLGLVARRSGELSLDMPHCADVAGRDAACHVGIGRRVAAIEADRERDASRPAGLDCGLCIATRQRKRLLDEDVLAGTRGRRDFAGVLGMRCRQHHRVDGGVGQNLGIARRQRQAEALGQRPPAGRIARHRRRKADLCAFLGALALNRADQALAPVSGPANRRAYHLNFILSSFSALPRNTLPASAADNASCSTVLMVGAIGPSGESVANTT